MTKFFSVLMALLLCAVFTERAGAAPNDRALLSLLCAPGAIAGAKCKRAKSYPEADERGCDVTLKPQRHLGRFLVSGNPLLVVTYESECESHANDFGGSVLFEQTGATFVFRGFQPGMRVDQCVMAGKSDGVDTLVCLVGHMGQGVLESAVARIGFAGGGREPITMTNDFLLKAEDTTEADMANVVTCAEPIKYFDLSKLAPGPRPGTVVADVTYADRETIGTACGKGFPKPKDAQDMRKLAPGEAYVPEDNAKRGSVIVDVAGRTAKLR